MVGQEPCKARLFQASDEAGRYETFSEAEVESPL